MKICFITYSIFDLGGIQRVTSVISSELSKNHDVEIVCTNTNQECNRELYNLSDNVNIEVNNLLNKNIFTKIYCKLIKELNKKTCLINNEKNLKLLTKGYYPKQVQEQFIEFLNSKNYDVVIGVGGEYSLLLGIIANKIRARTIGWQHNSFDSYLKTKGKYFWNQEILFKKYIPNLDKHIVLTNDDKKLYETKLNINSKVIYNPLSFESKNKSNCKNKSIIFVGRLEEEQKGLDLLLEAFKIVNYKNKQWKLKIIGDGPDKNKLIEYINKNNLHENIELIGKSNDVKKYYLESSIFVSTSRWEGFGLVITEAMECGLPVISFDNSGPREIINKNNKNGILIPVGDVEKLSEAIIYLIENEAIRISIAQQGIKRAQDFNIKTIKKQWCEILQTEGLKE